MLMGAIFPVTCGSLMLMLMLPALGMLMAMLSNGKADGNGNGRGIMAIHHVTCGNANCNAHDNADGMPFTL